MRYSLRCIMGGMVQITLLWLESHDAITAKHPDDDTDFPTNKSTMDALRHVGVIGATSTRLYAGRNCCTAGPDVV